VDFDSLEDDLASLEAGLGELDFAFDLDKQLDGAVASNKKSGVKLPKMKGKGGKIMEEPGEDDDLEAALRSIEEGKFDFMLPAEVEEDMDAEDFPGLELDLKEKELLSGGNLGVPDDAELDLSLLMRTEGSDVRREEDDDESVDTLVIDGVELDRKEFDLSLDPPPLEEFRRLMESLGPESIFDEEGMFDGLISGAEEEEEEEE
jgi:hypothetical protein